MARGVNVYIDVLIDPALLNKVAGQGKNGRITSKAIQFTAEKSFEEKQNELIKKFKQHSVSKEIDAGPKATNISGTLAGYGNLFSFLGFDDGSDPLMIIENILSEKLRTKVRSKRDGTFIVTVYTPTNKEIFAATPLAWASGLSWAEAIEKGSISNLSNYLFNPSGFNFSTSGTGIQSKKKVSGVKMKRTPYISEIIKDFKKELRKI